MALEMAVESRVAAETESKPLMLNGEGEMGAELRKYPV